MVAEEEFLPLTSAFKQTDFIFYEPRELQFSCAIMGCRDEEEHAKSLADGDPAAQLAAAKALWNGRSRRHAAAVLKFLAGDPAGSDEYRAFVRFVNASLQPVPILSELRMSDPRWGAWLAFLRPDQRFVPVLLDALDKQPKYRPEIILALRSSGDPRACEPLLKLVKSDDTQIAGQAAAALGYLGGEEVEPALLEALQSESPWVKVRACSALAKIGTERALSALDELAKDDEYTGAINLRGSAQHAAEQIRKRAGSEKW